MAYNEEHARVATQYLEKGMKPATIAALINKQYSEKYSALDIEQMVTDIRENPPPSENGRLFDIAAGIVFNPKKRKRIKIIAILILFAIVVSLVLLGLFVSWVPVAIIAGSVVGIILIIVLTIAIMYKTGYLEKLMEKF